MGIAVVGTSGGFLSQPGLAKKAYYRAAVLHSTRKFLDGAGIELHI